MSYKGPRLVALALTIFSAHGFAQAGGVTVLHAFTGGADGANVSSGVVVVSSSNSVLPVGAVLGTARDGGGTNCIDYWSNNVVVGCGTVYGLVQNGGWQFQVIYTFTGGVDGAFPGTLTLAPNGRLYGMTGNGGPGAVNGQGGNRVLFELAPPPCIGPNPCGGGLPKFRFKVLHNFCSQPNCADGAVGGSELFLSGNTLFGTTPFGGANGLGIVFKYELVTGKFTTLYSFQGNGVNDGAIPYDGVVADSSGNLYGTTYAGGGTSCNNGTFTGCGTVYELASINHGTRYQESVLYAFQGAPDGAQPGGRLIIYSNAPPSGQTVLIGNTGTGGTTGSPGQLLSGYGTTFQIAPSVRPTETILQNWGLGCLNPDICNVIDGAFPNPNLALAVDGTLWLSSYGGGYPGNDINGIYPGTISEMVPTPTNTGEWPFKQWYSFHGGTDGHLPSWGMVASPLSQYPNLVFFGTTSAGGSANGCPPQGNIGCGTVYQFVPPGYPN